MTEGRLEILEAEYYERLKQTGDYDDVYTLWVKGRPSVRYKIGYLERFLEKGEEP